MQKLFIENRKKQKIAVIVEGGENTKGLVFVMHGLGGFKEQPHIATFAKAFLEKGFTVVRFDTTNSIGESDGKYEDATTTNYYEDLEDVISWAKKQEWHEEPFWLVGHSLGGICITLYAQNYPEKVKAVAPISTVVSGQLSREAHTKEEMADWEKTGWQIRKSNSRPGLIKKLKWSHMEDRLKYDLLPEVKKLAMPILMVVGDQDDSTPVEHQKILFKALLGKKELHIIKGASHTFRDEEHLTEIKGIFLKWIEEIIQNT
ncbi:MAG: alpha/beta hydrolase [Patescibacteria group bacterium]|nr:alpha/beta hydrolase [Patescibacteria group bacterium]